MDESPAGYSWQVALQQSPLPLHQPELYCQSSTAPDNASAANGAMSLNWLSQPRGPVHARDRAASLFPFVGVYWSVTSTSITPSPSLIGSSAFPTTAPSMRALSVPFIAWPGVEEVTSKSPG